jgi:Immunity protein 49
MYIKRHEHGWNPEDLKEQLNFYMNDRLPRSLSKVTKKPDNLNSLLRSAINYAGYLSVLEPTSPQIYRALGIAAYTTKCIFLLADLSITEEYDLDVGEGPLFSFPQTGPRSYSDSGRWQEGFYLGAACREKHVLDSLVLKSTEIVRHPKASEGVDEHRHLMVDALKSFYNPDAPIEVSKEKLRAAIDAIDIDKIHPLTLDATINLVMPEMELLGCLLEGNAAHFNESLVDALECHKKYFSSDEQLSGDPRGFIAISILGLTCIAYDSGFSIEVESDYIPKYILEKQFLSKQKAS